MKDVVNLSDLPPPGDNGWLCSDGESCDEGFSHADCRRESSWREGGYCLVEEVLSSVSHAAKSLEGSAWWFVGPFWEEVDGKWAVHTRSESALRGAETGGDRVTEAC